MPRTISFTLPGEPVAWQRRVVTKAGQQFTPAKARARMAEVRWAFDQAAPGWKPHEGPVRLVMRCYFPPPKSWPKWHHAGLKRACGCSSAMPFEQQDSFRACCKKPDVSNLVKLIEDALNGLAYRDDAQIWSEHSYTMWGVAQTGVTLTFYDPPTRENATGGPPR